MKPSIFAEITEQRIAAIRSLMVDKADEYSRGDERFHNFVAAARLDGDDPIVALWGMWRKHLVSIVDIINDFKSSGALPALKTLEEKSGDNIVYSLLFEAMVKERLGAIPNAAPVTGAVEISTQAQSVLTKSTPGRCMPEDCLGNVCRRNQVDKW